MAKKEKSSIPAEMLALYDQLIAAHSGLERKGAAMPYTSMNGNMFSFFSADGVLALRLPEEERAAFHKKHKAHLMEAHGPVLKEYVAVPASLLKDIKTLKKYFALSVAYAKTLKPKATKK
jgi:hypothetical protein